MADIVPTFRLDNELTVVTGASGGLSDAILKGLLAYGSEIALLDMNLERTKETQAELVKFCIEELKIKQESVPKMHSYVCDISDADHVNEVFAKVYADFGKYPLHLVNTAGYCENFPAHEYPAKNAERLVKVNLLGSLFVAQAFAKPLIEHNIKGGSVVMIGSMSGEIVNDPQPQVAYNMSKAGVIHMVKSLAAEWAKYNIRVNTLSPGYILTPLTKNVINGNDGMYQRWLSGVPMGRLSEPKEFTGTVLYLLSNSASSYTTGTNITVDGGFTCWRDVALVAELIPVNVFEELVVLDLLDAVVAQSLFWVSVEQSGDQIARLRVKVCGEHQWIVQDLSVHGVDVLVVVWWQTREHLVEQNSQSPEVHDSGVALTHQQLWSKVLGRAAERVGLLVQLHVDLTQTKVA